MFSKTRERLRLEDELLERVQKAEIKYRWTVAASKSLLASVVPGQPMEIEVASAIERAAAAEHEALERYQLVLSIFTGLVVYGRTPCFRDRLDLLLTRAMEATAADMGILYIANPKRGWIIEAQSGFGRLVLRSLQRAGAAKSMCGQVLRTAQPLVVDNVADSPLITGKQLRDVLLAVGAHAAMTTPILAAGTVLGVISVYYRTATRPTLDQRMEMQRLAGEAAGIIKRQRAG
ncbi:MAG: GAF domain-containing protein [Bryobacteraceae bacterium]